MYFLNAFSASAFRFSRSIGVAQGVVCRRELGIDLDGLVQLLNRLLILLSTGVGKREGLAGALVPRVLLHRFLGILERFGRVAVGAGLKAEDCQPFSFRRLSGQGDRLLCVRHKLLV